MLWLHFDQCARKRPPIEKGSGQVICNSPGHGLVGDACQCPWSCAQMSVVLCTLPHLRTRKSACIAASGQRDSLLRRAGESGGENGDVFAQFGGFVDEDVVAEQPDVKRYFVERIGAGD